VARIRTIKPDFFTSEDIVSLSPLARLLYIALWCEADREGRFTWRPATFKLRYFPGDRVNIDALCKELTRRELVILYGGCFAYIPTFSNHQHVNPREAHSSLPVPDASARVTDAQVGKEGKEGKGKEGVNVRLTPDLKPQAEEVLNFLNSKTGRNYEPVDSTIKPILARLREGASVEDLRAVVAKKCREWAGNEKMDQYLRPKTLFNAENFANYKGELSAPEPILKVAMP
jgi:uncharacterized phage protein (TIGR02220 family)